jgi:regulatory protein
MKPSRRRTALPPLDEARLNELALRYVGRFATTRAKLRSYLLRKLRERGWQDVREPDVTAIAEQFAERGYIDDSSYALAKSQSLTGRGYGTKRVLEKLRAAGIEEDDGLAAREHAEDEAIAAAVRFAQRRRIGPFAKSDPKDSKERDKAIAAMIRAGHSFEIARALIALPTGQDLNIEQIIRLVEA